MNPEMHSVHRFTTIRRDGRRASIGPRAHCKQSNPAVTPSTLPFAEMLFSLLVLKGIDFTTGFAFSRRLQQTDVKR